MRTLRDTFESVLAQTHQDIDYIVVDGASTDGTLALIREYMPRFGGRMRFISEPDKGLYDAMNKGFALAQGEMIGILNSDDFFTSADVLEAVASAMADPAWQAVYGDVHFVRDKDLGRCVRYYSSRRFRPWMLHIGLMPAHPSFFCRKQLYEEVGLFDTRYTISADFELMIRLFLTRKIQARYLLKDFVTMRIGGKSTLGLASYLTIYREKRLSLRRNGFYASTFIVFFGYLPKVVALVSAFLRRLGVDGKSEEEIKYWKKR